MAGVVSQGAEHLSCETESERAYSEASTHADKFFIPASKRARTLWTEAARSSGSKHLTVANVEAASNQISLNKTSSVDSDSHYQCSASSKTERIPRFIQSSIQRFAVQSKSGAAAQAPKSLQDFVATTINSQDGLDILKLSCCLGYLLIHGKEALADGFGFDKVEGCVLFCVGRLRDICKEIFSSIRRDFLSRNMTSAVRTIALTALQRFAKNFHYSEGEGESFIWHIAHDKAGLVNSMAIATFCLGIWPFLKESCVCDSNQSVILPEISMFQSAINGRWWIRLLPAHQQQAFEIDVSLFHQKDATSSDTLEISTQGGPETRHEYDVTTVGKLLLVEFLKVESRKSNQRQSKWIRCLIDWNQKYDIGLCCFLPFLELIRSGLSSGWLSRNSFAELQILVSQHQAHEVERKDPEETRRVQRAVEDISEVLARCGGADQCTAGNVLSASVAVGCAADELMLRAEAQLNADKN